MKVGDLVRHVSYNSIGIVLTAANYGRQTQVAWVDGTTSWIPSHRLEALCDKCRRFGTYQDKLIPKPQTQ